MVFQKRETEGKFFFNSNHYLRLHTKISNINWILIKIFLSQLSIYLLLLFYSFFLICRFTFFSLIILHTFNKNKWVLSLTVPCFAFNFNSRKSKQTYFKNKQIKNIFSLKRKLNQVSFIGLPDWPLLRQVLENVILYLIICWYLGNQSIFIS